MLVEEQDRLNRYALALCTEEFCGRVQARARRGHFNAVRECIPFLSRLPRRQTGVPNDVSTRPINGLVKEFNHVEGTSLVFGSLGHRASTDMRHEQLLTSSGAEPCPTRRALVRI
jgi:hypothetical protein